MASESPSLKSVSAVSNDTATVRLHITPLTPSTLGSLIPTSIIDDTARESLSYHTIPTFPENSYAFLTLPVAKAEALKRKLNGSTFRGVKVRIEEARPQKEPEMRDDIEKSKKELKAERKEKRKRGDGESKTKKRKKGEDKEVLEGVQLPEGRKVARGWTKPSEPTSTSKKYAGKSAPSSTKKCEDDSKRECLFKTPLPPNKASTKEEKKKEKEDKKDKKKRKREVVVKEFKNNTKFPQFLKVAQLGDTEVDAMASEYVDGVGWVNGKGELVEEEKIKKRAADIAQMEVEPPEAIETPEPVKAPESEDDVKSTVSFSDGDETMVDVDSRRGATSAYVSDNLSSELEAESEDEPEDKPIKSSNANPPAANFAPVSDSESDEAESDEESNEESEESESESDTELKPSTPPSTAPKLSTLIVTPLTPTNPVYILNRTISTPTYKPLTPVLQITIPNIPSPSAVQVHPLEALYKPTTKQTQVVNATTSSSANGEDSTFKFGFGNDDDDDHEEHEPVIQTPYRERYRSAAPTPDTAIGHRRFFPDDSEDSTYHGKLGFVPSTPRAVGFPRGEDSFSRRGSVAAPTGETPLFFPHSESRFLGALSVWSKLPTPKAFTPEEPTVEEAEEATTEGKKDKRKKKAKGKKTEEEVGEAAEKTPAEVWSEKFYEKRGEWNRAWKGRRREVLKAKRKREAAAGPGKRVAI